MSKDEIVWPIGSVMAAVGRKTSSAAQTALAATSRAANAALARARVATMLGMNASPGASAPQRRDRLPALVEFQRTRPRAPHVGKTHGFARIAQVRPQSALARKPAHHCGTSGTFALQPTPDYAAQTLTSVAVEGGARVPDLRIYGIARTRAFRVLWVAKELGLDYEHLPIEIG